MNVSQSVKLAGILVALVVIYFMLRGMFAVAPETIAETPESRFAVIAQDIEPQPWRAEIMVRGRTEAERKVIVRAETAGVVAETPAILGAEVKTGDVLCLIATDARGAQLAEARAALAKAKLDYDAAVRLNQEGFRADTGVAAAKASLDLAAANAERASLELAKTKVAAPFDGVFDKRHVEAGDFVSIGDPCGTVIQRSPFLVTGAVSEKDVAKISKGDRGAASLATGETVEGVIRFVASAADPATRTFDVELEIPNTDGKLRDGVTAEFTVFAAEREAHRIPRSSLTLGEEGNVGVRSLASGDIVEFNAVRLLGEDPEGVWVAGLNGSARIITRGQEYVKAGQVVDVADPGAENEGVGL
ncbi:MAG: efflux RND transporter periplasmic adaptor subunit [Pseudomonadota bacterium]